VNELVTNKLETETGTGNIIAILYRYRYKNIKPWVIRADKKMSIGTGSLSKMSIAVDMSGNLRLDTSTEAGTGSSRYKKIRLAQVATGTGKNFVIGKYGHIKIKF
jgi:hypothetical protein